MSSVMSFDETPSSAKPNTDLSTFDGKKVKQRRRKKFPKAGKAKTALIRHLGSCWVCNKRRVPCDLEAHHDIQSLEVILEAGSNRPRSYPQSQPSITSTLPPNTRFASAGQATMGPVQADLLSGLGQNEALLQPSTPLDATLDIQTPAIDGASPDILDSAPLYYGQSDLPALSPNPYANYQNGSMFPIGVQSGPGPIFQCNHLQDYCFEQFNDIEDLQLHFETAHFAFTRIDPAYRFVCSACKNIYDLSGAPCYYCGTEDQTEIWVYGNYIRNGLDHRHSPDRQDLQRNIPGFAPYYPSSFNIPNSNLQGMNGRDFNGEGNPGNYDFERRNNNINGGGPGHGYTYNANAYNGSPNNTQFQGTRFQRAWHIMTLKRHTLHPRTSQRQKVLFALVLSLIIAITFFLSYNWTISKIRALLPSSTSGLKPSLSVLGFVGMVASSVLYLSVKRFSLHRARTTPKCPLHALSKPIRIIGCRVTTPDSYARGGIYS